LSHIVVIDITENVCIGHNGGGSAAIEGDDEDFPETIFADDFIASFKCKYVFGIWDINIVEFFFDPVVSAGEVKVEVIWIFLKVVGVENLLKNLRVGFLWAFEIFYLTIFVNGD